MTVARKLSLLTTVSTVGIVAALYAEAGAIGSGTTTVPRLGGPARTIEIKPTETSKRLQEMLKSTSVLPPEIQPKAQQSKVVLPSAQLSKTPTVSLAIANQFIVIDLQRRGCQAMTRLYGPRQMVARFMNTYGVDLGKCPGEVASEISRQLLSTAEPTPVWSAYDPTRRGLNRETLYADVPRTEFAILVQTHLLVSGGPPNVPPLSPTTTANGDPADPQEKDKDSQNQCKLGSFCMRPDGTVSATISCGPYRLTLTTDGGSLSVSTPGGPMSLSFSLPIP